MKKVNEEKSTKMTFTITGEIDLADYNMAFTDAMECLNTAVNELRGFGSAECEVRIPQTTIKMPY